MMLGHSVFRQPDVRSFKKYVLKVIFSSLVHSYDVTLFVIAKMGINLETILLFLDHQKYFSLFFLILINLTVKYLMLSPRVTKCDVESCVGKMFVHCPYPLAARRCGQTK